MHLAPKGVRFIPFDTTMPLTASATSLRTIFKKVWNEPNEFENMFVLENESGAG
jgi:hypothetical protein